MLNAVQIDSYQVEAQVNNNWHSVGQFAAASASEARKLARRLVPCLKLTFLRAALVGTKVASTLEK